MCQPYTPSVLRFYWGFFVCSVFVCVCEGSWHWCYLKWRVNPMRYTASTEVSSSNRSTRTGFSGNFRFSKVTDKRLLLRFLYTWFSLWPDVPPRDNYSTSSVPLSWVLTRELRSDRDRFSVVLLSKVRILVFLHLRRLVSLLERPPGTRGLLLHQPLWI